MKKRMLLWMFVLLIMVVGVGADLTDNNEVYFSFDIDDTYTQYVLDMSGNANNGTCVNMGLDCNTVAGLLLNASSFDGTNDYISNPNDLGVFDGTENFSVSLWFFSDAIATEKALWTPGNENQMYLETYQSKLYGAIYFTAGAKAIQLDVVLNQSQWYHAVLVYDTSAGTKLYLDGTLKGNDSTTGAIDAYAGTNTIGASYTISKPWNGMIDSHPTPSNILSALRAKWV